MGYFNKFPNLYYDVKKSKKFEVVVDILRRVRINTIAQDDASIYGKYIIKEQDRPDTIAHKLYGDSNLHWVILLFNEIHNPYYEWPMPYNEFIKYCEDKYPGKALLVQLDALSSSPFESVRSKRDHRIEPGYYAFSMNSSNQVTTNRVAEVVCWDRTLQKAVVIERSGSFLPNEKIAFAVTGGENPTASGVIKRVQLNMEALHHFENDLGVYLDPLGKYSAEIQRGEVEQALYSFDEFDRYIQLPFNQTLLGSYLSDSSEAQTINAVTNLGHEERINEDRRLIKLPSPEIVRQISNEFERVLNMEF